VCDFKPIGRGQIRWLLFCLAGLLCSHLTALSQGTFAVKRSLSATATRTNAPVTVTVAFTNSAVFGLRGFFYGEQLPSDLCVAPISVSVNGQSITNYRLESGMDADVYPGLTPWRWSLELPPSFAENNPVPAGSRVEIVYSVWAPMPGVYVLRFFDWAAEASDTGLAQFGTSGPADQTSLAVSGNDPPIGAQWTLWWQKTNGILARWLMVGTNAILGSGLQPRDPGGPWWVCGTLDLNDDQQPELLFQKTDGLLAAWVLDDTARLYSTFLNPRQVTPTWKIVATGDLNADGYADLLFENADGWLYRWLMDGTNRIAGAYLNPSKVEPSWQIKLTGYFSGNTNADILWENTDGRTAIWQMDGTNRIQVVRLNPSRVEPQWHLVGRVDMDGNNTTDLIWQHDSGVIAYWLMDGTNRVRYGRFPNQADPGWKVVGPR